MKIRQWCMLLLACLLLAGCSGKETAPKMQVANYKNWVNVKVDNTATFQIPPTMEIQSDIYRKKALEAVKNDQAKFASLQKRQAIQTKIGNIVCQQKGLNEQGPAQIDKQKYARVIFKTLPLGGSEKVPTYGQPLGLSAKQIKEYGEITKNGIIEGEKAMGRNAKFFNWMPMKSEIINGVECLHIAYERQIDSQPAVKFDVYSFFNKDRVHTLSIAYRLTEQEFWHAKDNDLNNIINTLQITKR